MTTTIDLTKKAITKIEEFAKAEGMKPVVRVKVMGGSCAGMQSDMSFDEKIEDLDEVFIFDNVKIVIDCFSLHYLEGTVIDFVESGVMGGAFKFNYPNDNKRSCGCGNSFGYY
jgi:iron-sulfur cluster insertion protein